MSDYISRFDLNLPASQDDDANDVLNLDEPEDEFGAVDFDYIQNQAGNFFSSQCLFFFL